MIGVAVFFLLLFVLFLSMFIYYWKKTNDKTKYKRCFIDEANLFWIHVISPDTQQRKHLKEKLYMNYDDLPSVHRQFCRKRLDNLFRYCDEYADNVEVLTKLDPYVKELGIVDDMMEKSLGFSLRPITSLKLSMIRYLKDNEHEKAFNTRDGLHNLIYVL
jgi:hypothetical protein